jgi:2-keto-4-pentenoate hydratase
MRAARRWPRTPARRRSGNPLNAVVWLVADLARTGRKLAAGDLVSVGSFTPLTPPKPGQAVTVRYEGFPGTPKVSLTFQ